MGNNWGVLISGNGSTLQALIDATVENSGGTVAVVIAQSPKAYGILRARRAGIPVETVPPNLNLKDAKSECEAWILDTLKRYKVRNLFLAGYMKVVSSHFIERFTNMFKGRIYNIHPSLLPKHKGLNAFEKAIEAKDEALGVTVHGVTADLDSGPVIVQRAYPACSNKLALHIQEQLAIRQASLKFLKGAS